MNESLYESQKDKKYMLWDRNKFHLEIINKDNYMIESIINNSKNNNTILCKTKNNNYINILIRWKNGNGIAFPALQIK